MQTAADCRCRKRSGCRSLSFRSRYPVAYSVAILMSLDVMCAVQQVDPGARAGGPSGRQTHPVTTGAARRRTPWQHPRRWRRDARRCESHQAKPCTKRCRPAAAADAHCGGLGVSRHGPTSVHRQATAPRTTQTRRIPPGRDLMHQSYIAGGAPWHISPSFDQACCVARDLCLAHAQAEEGRHARRSPTA